MIGGVWLKAAGGAIAGMAAAAWLAGCGEGRAPASDAAAPPEPPDTPRIAACKAVVERAAGPSSFSNALELPGAGGTVAIDVQFKTPAGSAAEERVTCHFEGEDAVQLLAYGSTLQPPPEPWRAGLDAAGVDYLKGG